MRPQVAPLDVVHHEEEAVVRLEREAQRYEVGMCQRAQHVALAHRVAHLHRTACVLTHAPCM